MRVISLVVICVLVMIEQPAAQASIWSAPHTISDFRPGVANPPIGSDEGLRQLERSALLGDKRASALLAVMLQDLPEVEGSLIKSALQFQVAIAAGCNDLDDLAKRAVARLATDDLAAYERALPHWLPPAGSVAGARITGRCLQWLETRPAAPADY